MASCPQPPRPEVLFTPFAGLVLAMHCAVPDTGAVRRVEVAPGDSVQLLVHGAGAPVVLIAGPIGGAWSFRQVVPGLLQAGYQVIVVDPFDPRNAGSSPPTLAILAERMGAALTALGVTPSIVVAHSVSNSIALRVALQHPQLVRALVSLEGGIAEQVATSGMRTAAALAHLVRLPGGGRLVRHRMGASLRERSARQEWVTDEVVRAYAQPLTSDASRVVRMMRQLGEADEADSLRRRLPDLRIPVLLLMGDTPHPSRPGEVEVGLMRAVLPAMSVEVVADAGHFLHEEQPVVVTQWVLKAAGSVSAVAEVVRRP